MVRQRSDLSALLTGQTLSAWQHPESTHSRRRRISRRATDLPWNLTFADTVKRARVRDSGCSRARSDHRNRFTARRLLPKVPSYPDAYA